MRETFFFRFEAPAAPITAPEIRKSNIVKGVSLVTVGWARGHIAWDAKGDMYPVAIDAETLRTVLECAKTYKTGLKVKVRHGSGPEDTCGHLSNFSVDGDKLRGDWTLYPTYDRYDHLVTLISTIPDTFGMSIDFSGPREFRDGYAYARCTEIYNCAVVDEPAANPDGLFDRSGGVMNPLIALARFAGIQVPPQPAVPVQSPPSAEQASRSDAGAAGAGESDATLGEIRDGLRAVATGLHQLLSGASAASGPAGQMQPPAPATPSQPPAPQGPNPQPPPGEGAPPAQGSFAQSAPAQPPSAQHQPAQAQPPPAPEARLTFDQLRQAALGYGIQLAARAGVPPVEQPAGTAQAAGAVVEPMRVIWARQFEKR